METGGKNQPRQGRRDVETAPAPRPIRGTCRGPDQGLRSKTRFTRGYNPIVPSGQESRSPVTHRGRECIPAPAVPPLTVAKEPDSLVDEAANAGDVQPGKWFEFKKDPASPSTAKSNSKSSPSERAWSSGDWESFILRASSLTGWRWHRLQRCTGFPHRDDASRQRAHR